ncbi:hypothetical protein [Roseibium sp.]|uniref:hypothetical protein n=1 Tax=Roseibium sp. TaxID=1936156 RepID=UPI003D10085A
MTNANQSITAETANDIHFGMWADLSLQLSEAFSPLIEGLVLRVLTEANLTANVTNIRNHSNAFSFILSNLIMVHRLNPDAYCLLSRRNSSYSVSPYNPNKVGSRALRRCFDFLNDNGFIEFRGGNYNHSGEGSAGGYVTRCRAQKSLLLALSTPETREDTIGECLSPGTTGNTNLFNNINSIGFLNLFKNTPVPIIRMRDENRNLVSTPDHPDLAQMTANLVTINSYLTDHWIDLSIPDNELSQALTNRAEENLPGERSSLSSVYNLAKQRTLYRVFNNGSFQNGGRFYGGWWQQIKSDYRKYITINWHPVSEVDYSSMQPAILYAMEGLDAPEDSYEIEGVPSEYRDLLKKTFLQVINAQNNRMRAPRQDELPPGMTFADLKEALRAKHDPIARHFNSGIGIEIQRIDSDIAETVMLGMMEHGQLALPVHDSFIVRSGNENLLANVMSEACTNRIGRSITTKTDPIWHYEITSYEDWVNHTFGASDVSDVYSNLIHQPEYRAFIQRRTDFLNYKGEEWGHTREWFAG